MDQWSLIIWQLNWCRRLSCCIRVGFCHAIPVYRVVETPRLLLVWLLYQGSTTIGFNHLRSVRAFPRGGRCGRRIIRGHETGLVVRAQILEVVVPLIVWVLLIHHLQVYVVYLCDFVRSLGDLAPSIEELALCWATSFDLHGHSFHSLVSVGGDSASRCGRPIVSLKDQSSTNRTSHLILYLLLPVKLQSSTTVIGAIWPHSHRLYLLYCEHWAVSPDINLLLRCPQRVKVNFLSRCSRQD